jgi:hypothetical protein
MLIIIPFSCSAVLSVVYCIYTVDHVQQGSVGHYGFPLPDVPRQLAHVCVHVYDATAIENHFDVARRYRGMWKK